MNYFQASFIEDGCISQIVRHCNRLFMNYSGWGKVVSFLSWGDT
jgi:hypothetical protein